MKEKLTKGLLSLCHLLAAWIRESASTLLSETKTVYNVRLKIEAEPILITGLAIEHTHYPERSGEMLVLKRHQYQTGVCETREREGRVSTVSGNI